MNRSNSCLPFETYLQKYRHPVDLTSLTSVRSIFIVLTVAIIFIGILANVSIVAAILKFRQLRNSRNIYIANLSISNAAVCSLSLPFTAYVYLYKEWSFTGTLCHFVPFLQGTATIVSIFSLTAISVDRYCVIVKSHHATTRQTLIVSAAVWVTAALISAPAALKAQMSPGSNFQLNFCGSFCQEHWQDPRQKQAYGFSLMVIQYLIPLAIIATAYATVVHKINSRIKFLDQGQSALSKAKLSSTLKRSQKTNRLLIGMIVTFGICWMPNIITNILRDLGVLYKIKFFKVQHYLFALICYEFSMTSTIWNPILYGYMNEMFRNALRSFIGTSSQAVRVDTDRTTMPRRDSRLAVPLLLRKMSGEHSGSLECHLKAKTPTRSHLCSAKLPNLVETSASTREARSKSFFSFRKKSTPFLAKRTKSAEDNTLVNKNCKTVVLKDEPEVLE